MYHIKYLGSWVLFDKAQQLRQADRPIPRISFPPKRTFYSSGWLLSALFTKLEEDFLTYLKIWDKMGACNRKGGQITKYLKKFTKVCLCV